MQINIKLIGNKKGTSMKKIIFYLIFIFISACGDKTYTVEDFIKNEKLFNDFYQKCENGEFHNQDINCINVKKANIKKYENQHKIDWK